MFELAQIHLLNDVFVSPSPSLLLKLPTGKRAKRTKFDFRFPISRSAIGQASCLICARRRQMTFPFCC